MLKPSALKPALLSLSLLLFTVPSHAQIKDAYAPGVPPPPQSMDPDHGKASADQPKLLRQVDLVKLQQEANELALAAQTIPSDVATVRSGKLPKDTLEKLKQIEKLSKRLRSELNP